MNVYTLSYILVAVMTAVEVLMMLRLALTAVQGEGMGDRDLLYFMTEPIIVPVRVLLWRVKPIKGAGVDISPAVTLFLLVYLKYLFVCRMY